MRAECVLAPIHVLIRDQHSASIRTSIYANTGSKISIYRLRVCLISSISYISTRCSDCASDILEKSGIRMPKVSKLSFYASRL